MPSNKNLISERIKEVRGSLSQREFARILGYKQPSIQQWESGGSPQIDSLIKIANAFQVDLNWLLLGHGDRYKNPLKNENANTDLANDTLWREKNPNLGNENETFKLRIENEFLKKEIRRLEYIIEIYESKSTGMKFSPKTKPNGPGKKPKDRPD